MKASHRIISQGLLLLCAREQNARCSPPALRNPLISRRGCTGRRRWRRGRTAGVAPVTVFFLRSFFSVQTRKEMHATSVKKYLDAAASSSSKTTGKLRARRWIPHRSTTRSSEASSLDLAEKTTVPKNGSGDWNLQLRRTSKLNLNLPYSPEASQP
ncbi:hypothetical protein U1Q18_021999 [Sarracenia purpurea var. burkii]